MATAMTLNKKYEEFLSQWNEWVNNVEAVYCPDFTEHDYEQIKYILEAVLEFGKEEVSVVYLDYVSQANWQVLLASKGDSVLFQRKLVTDYSSGNVDIFPAIVYGAADGCLEFTVVGNLLGLT